MKKFVERMSRFCIAISICDCLLQTICLLQTPNPMIMIFSAACGVALDVRRDPNVFSRDPRFVTRSVQDLNKW